jgi:hypothetical protein
MRKLFLPSYKTSNMAPRNFVWLTKQGLSGAGHRQRRLCSAPRPVAHMGRAVASSWKPTVAAEQSKAQPGHFLWGLAVWASPRAIWVYWGSAGSRAHPTCPRFGMPRRLCPLPSVPVVPGASRASLRLSAFMDIYIHPLYVLFSKILSSILNSSAPIHPLYHPLSTLSIVGSTYHFI